MERSAPPTLEELGPRFIAFASGLVRPVVFVDIEASGTDPISDRIVEICLVRVNPPPRGIESPRTWRINPGTRIPAEASEIHGIRNEDVAHAPIFAELSDDLAAILSGADLAGFNVARFDARILQSEFARAGRAFDLTEIRILDMQTIFHLREPRTLAAALRFYRGKELAGAHSAEADTLAALEVLAGQLDRYADLDCAVDALHAVSQGQNLGFPDQARRFVWRDHEPVFNFGRLRGKALRWAANDPTERAYLRWILDTNFGEDTKAIVRDALAGKIRRREPP
jgi:DNA polymerase-3 subunit epsilon